MKCNTCNIEFKSYFDDNDQADGCAATLYLKDGTYYILGHYGSNLYDMQRYALRHDKYETGNICDACITKLIDHGNAQLIEDGVW